TLAAIIPTPTPTQIPPIDGEFGDAPDETYSGLFVWDAYPGIPGMQAARFPTFYQSIFGADPYGTCFTAVGYPLFLSFSNTPPSFEADAYDLLDPDGMPNIDPFAFMCDMDSMPTGDDGTAFTFSPFTGVTIYLQGSTGYFYLLADLNQDGDWNEPNELLIANYPANLVGTPEFIPIPGGFQGVTGEVWVRAVISNIPIPNFSSTWPFWDGSLSNPAMGGEVEDYLLAIPPDTTPTPPTYTPTPTPTIPSPQLPVTTPIGITLMIAAISVMLLLIPRRNR
ncbi:hypothetical protein JXA80_08590, partial [bacterium]|nr:hypothetical protein [candidate division CSSED10-310 bacterium]